LKQIKQNEDLELINFQYLIEKAAKLCMHQKSEFVLKANKCEIKES
jgi:hypothetical protein